MHRIDTKTAQKDKFGAGKNGFTRGNPQTGTPATDLDDDYFDMLQEELCSVVEASGASLEKGRHDQLLTALRALLLSRKNPFGDIKSDGTVKTALENLGLGNLPDFGDAASKDVGTTAGTVAAGDDARFGKMFGVGQTPQDVTASRSLGVTYTNSTGKPIAVGVAVRGGISLTTTASLNGVPYCYDASTATNASGNGVWFVVPDGMTYSVECTQTAATITFWTELR